MNLKVGECYTLRDGSKVGPITTTPENIDQLDYHVYPFYDKSTGDCWKSNGSFLRKDYPHDRDITKRRKK